MAGIYAQVLGLERVGVEESFFELGGDSILSMQVVARARAAGVLCRPRDIFVEQTVARLARVAAVADGDAEVIDEGIGPVVATPIISWLHGVEGPTDQFNQAVLVQAPVGVTGADVVVVVQALLDRHPTLRLRVDDDGAGGWSLTVPEAGTVDARQCLHTVDVLSDAAVARGAVAVGPDGRGDAQRPVGGPRRAVDVDRSPSGGRRGVVADFAGGPQLGLGPASRWAAGDTAGGRHLIPTVGVAAGRACAPPRRRGAGDRPGGRSRPCLRHCRRCNRRWIPMPPRGTCRCSWTPRPPGCCSVRCRRRFIPGYTTFC